MSFRKSRFAKGQPRPANRLGAFRRDERGVTAIEFGIISAPLLGLIFAIMQSSLAFFEQQGLRAALDAAARQVLTGEANNNAAIVDGPSFRDQLDLQPGHPPELHDLLQHRDRRATILELQRPRLEQHKRQLHAERRTVHRGAALPDHDRARRLPDAVVPASDHLGGTPFTFVQNVTGLTTYNGKVVQMLSAASVFRNEPFVAADGSDGDC